MYEKGKVKGMNTVLKTSSTSNPHSVAGAIAGTIDENGIAEIQAIGAGALNQAVKAVIIARGFFAPRGIDLLLLPSFLEIEVNGEKRTAIRLSVCSHD